MCIHVQTHTHTLTRLQVSAVWHFERSVLAMYAQNIWRYVGASAVWRRPPSL